MGWPYKQRAKTIRSDVSKVYPTRQNSSETLSRCRTQNQVHGGFSNEVTTLV
jgi:hypothetical protein